MDHVRLDIDPDVDAAFPATSNPGVVGGSMKGIAIPIEAKLRLLSTRLLYEVCRVQKLSLHDLRMSFIILLCSISNVPPWYQGYLTIHSLLTYST